MKLLKEMKKYKIEEHSTFVVVVCFLTNEVTNHLSILLAISGFIYQLKQ